MARNINGGLISRRRGPDLGPRSSYGIRNDSFFDSRNRHLVTQDAYSKTVTNAIQKHVCTIHMIIKMFLYFNANYFIAFIIKAHFSKQSVTILCH